MFQDPEMQAAMLTELRMVPEAGVWKRLTKRVVIIWISTAPGQVHSAMINKLEDAYQIVRQAVVEFVFHLAEVHQKNSKEH